MSDDPRDPVERLFLRLAPLDPEARAAALEAGVAGDAALRAEVESLLAAYDADGLVDRLEAVLLPGSASASGDLTGRSIRNYRVLALIGRGGMGDVYRARDTRLDRDVALKLLPPWLGRDESAEERLLLEARVVSGLDHENICALLEVDRTEEGRLFLVTPFYEGETLEHRLARGPLPVQDALDAALQVANGLAAAHARGIVHRDIKPANLLLTTGGRVKILDFGIAKLADRGVTRPGEVPGTARYMSPEHAAGGPVDARSDLWALGVVLYEMLTGERPVATARSSLTTELRRGLRDSGTVTRGAIPGLARLLDRLLQPDPADRYPDAQAVARDLVRALDGGSIPARRRRMTQYGLLAVGGAVIIAWLAWPNPLALRRGAAGSENGIRGIAVLPLADHTGDPARAYLPAAVRDALITELVRNSRLKVISEQSVARYDDSDLPLATIADQLGVDAIVEGAVFLAGDTLRITVRLSSARPERLLWSEQFAGATEDALAVQRAAARGIAEAVSPTPGTGRPARPVHTADPRAWDRYMQGLVALQRHVQTATLSRPDREASVRSAIALFEEAVRIDPGWPAAHARLASAYHWLASGGFGASEEFYRMSKASALRAIELDETEAQAHASLGFVLLAYDMDWAAAEREIRRALELEPSSGNHWIYALYLSAMGRAEEAIVQFHAAEERDPLSEVLKSQIANAYVCAGRHSDAIAQYDELWRRIGPRASRADSALQRSFVGLRHSAMGRHAEAVAELEHAVALSDSAPQRMGLLAYALARAGRRDDALRLLAWLEQRPGQWSVPGLHVVLGDTAKAVGEIEQSFRANRRTVSNFLLCSELYPMVRDQPRIRQLVEEIGYPD